MGERLSSLHTSYELSYECFAEARKTVNTPWRESPKPPGGEVAECLRERYAQQSVVGWILGHDIMESADMLFWISVFLILLDGWHSESIWKLGASNTFNE